MKPEDNSLESSYTSSEHNSSLEGGYQVPPLPEQAVKTQRSRLSLFRFNKLAAVIAVSTLLFIILIGGGAFIYDKVHHSSPSQNSLEANGTYKNGSNITVKGSEPSQLLTLGQVNQLAINGQLTVNKTIVITPSTTAPSSPSTGEVYFNASTNEPYFYNGSQFVSFLSTASPQVSSLGGTTGAIGLGSGLSLSGGKLSVSNSILQLTNSSSAVISNVSSLDALTGSVNINDTNGSGSTITIQSASTTQAGIAQFSSNDFQVLGSGSIDTIQGISPTSDVQFDSLALDYGSNCTAGGNLCLNSSGTVYAAKYVNPSSGNNSLLVISSGTGSESNIQFSDDDGANTFLLPSTGGTGQTFCTTGITCASGGGQAVILGPSGVQDVSSNLNSLYIDKTGGTGNLVDLQTGSSQNALVIDGNGNATFSNTTTAATLDVTGTLQTETITPNASLSIGSTSQSFTLQGNSSSELYFQGSGNSTYVGYATPTGNTVTSGSIYYAFDDSAATSTQSQPWFICTTAGNCVGLGGGVSASSGSTQYYIPLFSTTKGNGGNIVNSILSQPSGGSTIDLTGTLDVTTNDINGATINGSDIDGATLSGGTLSGGTVSGSSLSSTQLLFSGSSGTVTTLSGDNLTLDTGGGTSTLNLGTTNATTIQIGNTSSTTNLYGLLSQNYSSGTAATADSYNFTNSNSSSAGSAIQGISITPLNKQTPSSGTNVLNLLNFAASSNANGGSDLTNGINFASTTGYTNFIDTPTFILQSSGNITGAGTYDGATINGSDIDGATLSGGTLSGGTVSGSSLSSTQLLFSGSSGTVTTLSGDNLTLDTGGGTSTLNLGTTNATTIQIGNTSWSSGTQTINIGNNNTSGGITNIVIGTGSSASGNLTLQAASGIVANSVISQAISTGSSSGTISLLGQTATNNNTSASSTTINAHTITLIGTSNSGHLNANTLNGINFNNVTAATNNIFNGLYFGTGYNYLINTSNSDFTLTDAGTLQDTGTVSITGSGATALTVQGASGQNIATLNNSGSYTVASFTSSSSSSGSLNLGSTGNVTGNLVFEYSGGSSGTVTLSAAVSSAASSYSLVLPTAAPTGTPAASSSASNQCLEDTSGSSSTVQLSFGNCSNSHSKIIQLAAEYAGAVLDNASDSTCSSASIGTMFSGYSGDTTSNGNQVPVLSGTVPQNYYDWYSTQSSSQCYDIIVQIPIPADWSSFSSSTHPQLYIYTPTDTAVAVAALYGSGQEDANYGTYSGGQAGYTSLTNSTCTANGSYTSASDLCAVNLPYLTSADYTAGSTLTLKIRVSSNSYSGSGWTGQALVGDLTIPYTTAY